MTDKLLRAGLMPGLAALFLAASAATSFAASFSADAKGTSAAQFLKLGAGARAAGMGEAYSAVCEDADSVYWNPGALSGIKKHSGLFMHADLFTEFSYEYIGYARPLKDLGGIGLGVQYMSAGSIPQTDSSGFATGSSMNPSQTAIALAYGRKLDVFGVGVSAKYVRSRLAGSASAFAVDVGALSPGFMAGQMRLSLVIQNIGGALKYDQKADPLPLNIRIGSQLKFLEDLTIGVDINSPRDNSLYFSAGGEYLVHYDNFSVAGRLGYNTRTAGDLGGLTGFSLGLGAERGSLALDYAFAPFGELGSSHKLSVAFRFESLTAVQKADAAILAAGPMDLLVNDPDPSAFIPEMRGVKLSTDALRNDLVHAEILAGLRNYAGAAANMRAAAARLSTYDARRVYLLERQGWLALAARDIPKAKQLYIDAIQLAKKLKFSGRAVVNAYCGLAFCMEKGGDILAAELNYNHAQELTADPRLSAEIGRALKRLRLLEDQ